MKNNRSKYWTIILYDDSDNLNFIENFEKLKNISNSYVYVYHNKDEVKPHFHLVLGFNNYKWLNSLSEETEIPTHYFQPVRNLDNILTYLIHFKEENKYHYSLDDINGSIDFINKLKKAINKYGKEEDNLVYDIFEFIISNPSVSFTNLVKWVLENGYWAEFRRASSIFIKILDENNNKYYNEYRKEK